MVRRRPHAALIALFLLGACGPDASDGVADSATSGLDDVATEVAGDDTLEDVLVATETLVAETDATDSATETSLEDTATDTLIETTPEDTVATETADDVADAADVIEDPLAIDEPNDEPEDATVVALAAAPRAEYLATKSDVDWFSFTTPAEGPSGYLKIVLASTSCDAYGMTIYVHGWYEDEHRLNPHILTSIDQPARSTMYIAAAPSLTYDVEVHAVGSFAGSCAYTIAATYTAVPDAFETADAAPIVVGQTVEAFLTAGWIEPYWFSRDHIDDRYTLELVEGVASVSVDPPYYSGQTNVCVSIVGPDTNSQNCAQPGNGVGVFTTVSAGMHSVRVSYSSSFPSGVYYGSASGPPTEFSQPYTLTVSQ